MPSALLKNGEWYWTHAYKTFAVKADLPALGYRVYTLTEKSIEDNFLHGADDSRIHEWSDRDIVLENEWIRAVFDSETMLLKSCSDKQSGEELVSEKTGAFTLIQENPRHRGTAWIVGERMSSRNLNKHCPVCVKEECKHALFQSVSYEIEFGHGSKLEVTVSLNAGDRFLKYSARCDFQELGSEQSTPLLAFETRLAYGADRYRYDIPYGVIDRDSLAHDVPAESFVCALNAGKKASLMLMSDCKHGFRGCENTLSLSLLRATRDPDTHPENGWRSFCFALASAEATAYEALKAQADRLIHRPIVSACEPHGEAILESAGSFLNIEGARLGAVKRTQDGKGLVLRLVNAETEKREILLSFPRSVASACWADINERPTETLTADGTKLKGEIGAGCVETLIVCFA